MTAGLLASALAPGLQRPLIGLPASSTPCSAIRSAQGCNLFAVAFPFSSLTTAPFVVGSSANGCPTLPSTTLANFIYLHRHFYSQPSPLDFPTRTSTRAARNAPGVALWPAKTSTRRIRLPVASTHCLEPPIVSQERDSFASWRNPRISRMISLPICTMTTSLPHRRPLPPRPP
ncbi:hypothetical protein F4780DRAFT_638044 [Xylariomycetidae sp. FL0641]|nr:hypothetical protein F4780DRAFT_638044 [Xylariomycetidae sp. FL0641]